MNDSIDGDARLHAKARQEAFRFLSYRNRSKAEVRRKLALRYPNEVVEQVITRLVAQRYLDDVSFASEWRRQREKRRPRGQSVLKGELLALGVDREVIQEALEGIDEATNAYHAAGATARRLAGTDYQRFRQKVWTYLQRRGFEQSAIRSTVERYWSELADLLDGSVDTETEH
jgi:regulatory protein